MADFPSLRVTEIAVGDVETPPTGKVFVFIDSADKHLKTKDDTGTIIDLTSPGAAKDFAFIGLSANQTTNIANGNHVEWDTIREAAVGSGITLSTGAGQADGLITLPAGKIFVMESGIEWAGSASTSSMQVVWSNNTDVVLIGNIPAMRTLTSALNVSPVDQIVAFIDTSSGAKEVESQIGSVVTVASIDAFGSYASIREL
ncbi:MAG: hypothetical protein V3T08_09720 [Gemmatimonadota bacterium]